MGQRFTLRIDDVLVRRLQAEADALQTTASSLARQALQVFLDGQPSDNGVCASPPGPFTASVHDLEQCAAALLSLCPLEVRAAVGQTSDRTGLSQARVLICLLIAQFSPMGSPTQTSEAMPRMVKVPGKPGAAHPALTSVPAGAG
jgi:hypothetical protein